MADYILVDNDIVNFMPTFGPATVGVLPGNIPASGPATLNRSKLCVDGDEKKVEVSGCMYVAPPYVIPGTGTLKIQQLAPNQKAMKTKTGGKAVLLKGAQFQATFEVQSPAQQPPPGPGPPIPDPMTQYPGQGMFQTINLKFQGT